jgi:hypothetical protein
MVAGRHGFGGGAAVVAMTVVGNACVVVGTGIASAAGPRFPVRAIEQGAFFQFHNYSRNVDLVSV